MIPVLYSRDTDVSPGQISSLISDTTNGLGRLSDCISAVVTEERNGAFELEIEYPVNGAHFDEISYNSWIKVRPFVNGTMQLFRVYKISKPINGICAINAEHISYLMSTVVFKAIRSDPIVATVEAFVTDLWDAYRAVEPFNFTLTTTMTGETQAQFEFDKAQTLRELLMGDENSMVSGFPGGEFGFDNLNACYYAARGSNKNVKISYGKNMTALRQDISDEIEINGVYPYWTGNINGQWTMVDRSYYGEPYVCIYDNAALLNFGFYPRIVPLDMTGEYNWGDDNPPVINTQTGRDDFQAYADAYFAENENKLAPDINIDVSFVDLASTEEYKNTIPLQTINLCDIVTVEYLDFNINIQLKVVKTEYNVLEERYNAITLGSLRKTLN